MRESGYGKERWVDDDDGDDAAGDDGDSPTLSLFPLNLSRPSPFLNKSRSTQNIQGARWGKTCSEAFL